MTVFHPVSTPHPGEPEEVSRPKRSTRKWARITRVYGPDWDCNLCAVKAQYEGGLS